MMVFSSEGKPLMSSRVVFGRTVAIMFWVGSGLLIAGSLTGCGPGGPEMARVSGTVSYQGEPLSKGSISFVSTEPGRPNASGPIVDGSYTLQTREPNDGAELGEYKIAITDIDPDAANTALPGEPIELVSTLPEKYQNPDQSGLTRTVESGRNTFDFNLE